MYYVKLGQGNYLCVRLTGSRPEDDDETRPFFIRRYDFDDSRLWTDKKLEDEYARVNSGKDYDGYAMVAISMEQMRRQGKEYFRTYGEWNDMIDALSQSERDADWEDDEDDEAAGGFPEAADASWCFSVFDISDLTDRDWTIIQKLAELELKEIEMQRGLLKPEERTREGFNNYLSLMDECTQWQNQLLKSEFADAVIPNYGTSQATFLFSSDRVIALRKLSSHLMFMYGHARLEAEVYGEELKEDLFYAGMNCHYAAETILKMLEEAGETGEDDFLFPELQNLTEEQREELAEVAEKIGDFMKNADLNDPAMQMIKQTTDTFLKEKGFDVTTIDGLKEALNWLEHAKVEEAFYNVSPIEDPIDWNVGEARLDVMQRIVRDKIERIQRES
ncbi:MAG: hypothetical protein IJ719_18600 [Clostridia bacterium]|nr:hypothetical protein [Clostridia bacterium]